MDDGLAEKLFYAFWKPIVDAGYPPPAKWDDLGDAQRTAWQAAAVAARGGMNAQIEMRTEMLEGANAAWQREVLALNEQIKQLGESARVQVRASLASLADSLEEALKAPHSIGIAMLQDLAANVRRISEAS